MVSGTSRRDVTAPAEQLCSGIKQTVMDIEFGNAGKVDTHGTGWFVGFSDWTKSGGAGPNLRYMPKEGLAHTIHAKWMHHPAGDDRGTKKPPSEGRTISIMVSEGGLFRIEFAPDERFDASDTHRYVLKDHADFVIWGEDIYHRWFVDEDCTILTLRWVPVPAELPRHEDTKS